MTATRSITAGPLDHGLAIQCAAILVEIGRSIGVGACELFEFLTRVVGHATTHVFSFGTIEVRARDISGPVTAFGRAFGDGHRFTRCAGAASPQGETLVRTELLAFPQPTVEGA